MLMRRYLRHTHHIKPTFSLRRTRAVLSMNLQSPLQRLPGIIRRLPHELRDVPELLDAGVAHDLVDPALGGRDGGAGGAQPRQRDGGLGVVAAADPVGEHVDGVAAREQVQRRLRHADVALDAHDGDLAARRRRRERRGRRRREPVRGDLGRHHAEERLVCLHGCVLDQGLQLRHDGAQLRPVLCRHDDGDLEDLRGAEDLLGREEAKGGKNIS